MNSTTLKYKSFSILKQPAYRIVNSLKKDENIDIGPEDIRLLIENVKKFFRNNYKQNIRLIFIVDYKTNGDDKYINLSEISREIMFQSAKCSCIHYIDLNCNLIKTINIKELDYIDGIELDQDTLEYLDINFFSEYINSTVIYNEGVNYEINHRGLLLENDVIVGSKNIYGKLSKNMFLASEYKKLIQDHYEECVKYANASDHWTNKKDRILRDSCEDIFKKFLWYYLYKFTLDAIEVVPEYNLSSGNRIDIVIRTDKNILYAFEIKVLGSLKGGKKDGETKLTIYSEDRVHHGLNQLVVYLDEETTINRAALVVYDGRKNQNYIEILDHEKHPKLDLPIILYLESDNATEKAKSTTKLSKKIVNN